MEAMVDTISPPFSDAANLRRYLAEKHYSRDPSEAVAHMVAFYGVSSLEELMGVPARTNSGALGTLATCWFGLFPFVGPADQWVEVDDIGIIRVEQLYPLRASELQKRLASYPKDVDVVWVQEEPWNMGAWYFMRARLPEILGNEQPLRCIARPESASPATGSGASHKLEQKLLVDEVFS